MHTVDVAVIGAGFGGLATALTLAEEGLDTALFERLTYPGGCASTFYRRGYRFEAGATLFSGFGPGQLFDTWIKRHNLPVRFESLDPLVTLRTAEMELAISSDRHALTAAFCAIPGAPTGALRRFFAYQQRVADALWALFDDPTLLPPFTPANLTRHLGRSPRYLVLLNAVGRSVGDVLKRFELASFQPLRTYLNAVCQITVQASADQAEAPFALAAIDYFFRGTGHIHGGIGQLATALTDAIQKLGGQVYMADPVRRLTREHDHWVLQSRRRTLRARFVVANLLPAALLQLLDDPQLASPSLDRHHTAVQGGWGAAMLYLGVDRTQLARPEAFHLELVDQTDAPFREGNHVFCSVSDADEAGRAPDDQRVVTLSTHVRMARYADASPTERAAYIHDVQERMRQTLKLRAPELSHAIRFEMTASPRTFERFTARPHGYVGGVPRRKGLQNYRDLGPQQVAPDLYLVGDSVFPGQSTLAVALGGLRTARAIL
ncbi:FAD-dependent oxidoreductase [Lujinxingia litoralis]|uniref:FAD-dependent oxidoreductase n=1 Tax=Lujinxingia litoralis TaxID=2211119 RepID=A0A328C0U4_9DELT|nr:FAD-dependent oxidoreductase [Lujinxingia litoralis]RAL20196.1 FAD-dependent oxidoreductase [Lujinxingia litoralis]